MQLVSLLHLQTFYITIKRPVYVIAFSELSSSNQAKNTKKAVFLQYYSTPASAPDGDEAEVWFQKWQRKCVTDRNDKALSTAGETMKWKAFPLSLGRVGVMCIGCNMCRVSYTILFNTLVELNWMVSREDSHHLYMCINLSKCMHV